MLKRLLIVLVFICGVLVSKPLNNFDKKELNYAITLIKSKKYTQAEIILSKLAQAYSQNEKINFYLGLSKFNLKKYEEAFVYYDRVLIKNPKNVRARLEMARVYVKLKNYKKAKEELEKALLLPMPQIVRKNVNRYLKLVNDKERRYRLNGAFIVGIGYDDNINNNTYIETTPTTLLGGLILQNDTKKLKNMFHQEALTFNHIYFYNDKVIQKTNILFFQQIQQKYSSKNIFLAQLTTGPSFKFKRSMFGLNFGIDKLWYGSEDYMHDFLISANYKYLINKNSKLNIDLSYKNKNYTAYANNDRESTVKGLSLTYKRVLKKGKNISLSTSFQAERKKRGSRVDIDKDTKIISINYSQKIIKGINLKVGFRYKNESYKDYNPTFGKKRDDTGEIYSLSFDKKLSKDKVIALSLSHTHNHSNIGVYSYKKNRAIFTFIKSF